MVFSFFVVHLTFKKTFSFYCMLQFLFFIFGGVFFSTTNNITYRVGLDRVEVLFCIVHDSNKRVFSYSLSCKM